MAGNTHREMEGRIGTGYATPLVVGDRVFEFSRIGENETMTALDAASGKIIWQAGYPATFAMNPATKQHGPGPKSTPVFFNGRLYSIGMTGTVTAWDAASGKQVWQKAGTGPEMLYTTPRVLAGHRRRPCHLPRGRQRQGRADGFRREHRSCGLELDRGWSRLRLAGRRHLRRRPSDRDADTDEDRRRRCGNGRAALGAADGPPVHCLTRSRRSSAARWSSLPGTGPLFAFAVARRAGQWSHRADLGKRRAAASIHDTRGRGRHAFRPLEPERGAVLRNGREDRQDALDLGWTSGRARVGCPLGRPALQPRERRRAGHRP